MKPNLYYMEMENRFGPILLVASDQGLAGCYFVGQKYMPTIAVQWTRAPDHAILQTAKQQLTAYAEGKLQQFDLPFAFAQGTEFQQRVWRAIAAIPYGKTITYGDLALRVGAPPGSARAAGAATGRNPISVIVPCHRVLGSTGSLTGYAGGLDRKKALLTMEGVLAETPAAQMAMDGI